MPDKHTPDDAARLAAIRANHPLQYGYRLGGGAAVYDPPPDDTGINERYDRCPVCEQWSPCDVRWLLDRLAAAEADRVAARAALARYADEENWSYGEWVGPGVEDDALGLSFEAWSVARAALRADGG